MIAPRRLLHVFAVMSMLVGAAHPALAADDVPMGASMIDAGSSHVCAVLEDGAVRCWGWNVNGQLGLGSTSAIGDNEIPESVGTVNVGAGRTATAVGGGGSFSCALLDNGSVRCWGYGFNGQLGNGTNSVIGDDETAETSGVVDFGAGRTATKLSVGSGHACAVLDDESLHCWGFNREGELGLGHTDDMNVATSEVNLGEGRKATAVSAGHDHTCVILDGGAVRCWGANEYGQLGLGNTGTVGDDETPGSVGDVNLGPGRTATSIAAGVFHTCAVLDNGAVRCWGWNSAFGMLGTGWGLDGDDIVGDDEVPADIEPVNLGPGRTATAVAGGGFHTCALLDTGNVRCWGGNYAGQLGLGNTVSIGDDETPAAVAPVQLGRSFRVIAITAGDLHTCVLFEDRAVSCWGDGSSGALGYGNTATIGDDEYPAVAGTVRVGRRPKGDSAPSCPEGTSPSVVCRAIPTSIRQRYGCATGDEAGMLMIGTSLEETFVGAAGGDIVIAGGGRDLVSGFGGSDSIWTGDGRDTVSAGSGDDCVHGGAGADTIHGRGGDDLLFGDAGRDGLYGNAGDDRLFGGAGRDVALRGGAGNNIIRED